MALRGLQSEPALQEHHSPLVQYYKETLAVTDTTLRMAQMLPDAISGQLPLCEGMEVILNDVGLRTVRLRALTAERRITGGANRSIGLSLVPGQIRRESRGNRLLLTCRRPAI